MVFIPRLTAQALRQRRRLVVEAVSFRFVPQMLQQPCPFAGDYNRRLFLSILLV